MIGKSLFIGENIEFTALDPEKDTEILSSWTRDQVFVQHLFEEPFRQYAVYELKKKIKEKIKKADENQRGYFFAIRKKGEAEIIGLLRFGWIFHSHQSGRLFLDFSTEECLLEFGNEALKMALRYAFMEMSLHRLWVEFSTHQIEEINLFEKAGFLREVQRRDASFFDGKYFDQVQYSILKPEWKKLIPSEVQA
jgi:RimJ/RimL family protein N-acetyltransferase